MHAVLIGIVALLTLVIGTVMGVASLLLLPVVGAVVLVAVLVLMLIRRAQHKPPMS